MKVSHPLILIVEDDPNDQFLIQESFRRLDLMEPVCAVDDGSEAIAYLKGEGEFADREQFKFPTFLMLDLKMPKVNGFELLQFLKSNPQFGVIPTIVLTSSADPDDIKKAYLLGANSYHVKPKTLEALRNQLKILHDYWMTCDVPEVDKSGNLLRTEGRGKLSENIKR